MHKEAAERGSAAVFVSITETCERANVRTCERANVRTCERANVRTCERANVKGSEASVDAPDFFAAPACGVYPVATTTARRPSSTDLARVAPRISAPPA